MAHPTDPRDDAPTEWLTPMLYRQLCEAVDSALTLPPGSREAVLAARLGDDPRLLGEARALLASYEASPNTVVPVAPPAAGTSSGTAVIAGVGPGLLDSEGTLQVPAGGWEAPVSGDRPASGTMVLPASPGFGDSPESGADTSARSGSRPAAAWDDTPVAVPQVPKQGGGTQATLVTPRDPGSAPEPPRAAYAPPAPRPIPSASPSSTSVGAPFVPPFPPAETPPFPSAALPSVPPPAPPEPPAPAPVPLPPAPAAAPDARAVPQRPEPRHTPGAPIPVRPSGGSSVATALGALVLIALVVALGGAVWFWLGADQARRAAEANLAQATQRLALSERRFDVVRQLGTRLPEVDNVLAVTEDAGARTARAVLVRTWLQYLQDLQRASGGTDRDLLLEIARGYKRVAATQGGGARALGDLGGATKTLQIGIRLLEYLDRTARQPDPAVLRELTGSQVALGDVLVSARDAAASAEQYRKALAAAERLGSLPGNEAEARREVDAIRQRLQATPPPPTP